MNIIDIFPRMLLWSIKLPVHQIPEFPMELGVLDVIYFICRFPSTAIGSGQCEGAMRVGKYSRNQQRIIKYRKNTETRR